MAGKITELTELATVADEDLLEIVDDPAGTPASKKITRGNLIAGLSADTHDHDADYDAAGSAAAAQAAAEATAAAALGAHTGDTSDAHDASAISIADAAGDFTATDVEGALAELQSDAEAHAALPAHTGAAGTAFPGSPTTGDRFFRTDRGIEYFYDGTRWLSTHLYALPVAFDAAVSAGATNNSIGFAPLNFPEVYDHWVESAHLTFDVFSGSALSGSHNWVVTLYKDGSGGWSQAIGSGVSFTIDSGALDQFRVATPVSVNALLGSTFGTIRMGVVKTGTPGNIIARAVVHYRLVG